jgi:putative glutamine amidotransferase
MNLVIGLSYAPEENPKFNFYREALRHAAANAGDEIEIVDLSAHSDRLADCDGVVFTGGSDIQPARYGKQAEENLCQDIDEVRDQGEFELARHAEERDLPILGICRGLQLLNIHNGGTLITDVQTFGARNHARVEGKDIRHRVKVEPGSYLSKVLRIREGEINSAHHQAAERVGDGLVVTARAEEDGTIEALEYSDPTGKPFFLAVQWHPERMQYDEPFAGRLFESFLWEVAMHKTVASRKEKTARETTETRS